MKSVLLTKLDLASKQPGKHLLEKQECCLGIFIISSSEADIEKLLPVPSRCLTVGNCIGKSGPLACPLPGRRAYQQLSLICNWSASKAHQPKTRPATLG
jgi:hypothetical protein